MVQKRFSLRIYLQKPLLRCQTAYTTALVALYIGLWFWTLWLQTMKSESHRHTFILNTVLDHCTHQYMSCMINGGQFKKKKKKRTNGADWRNLTSNSTYNLAPQTRTHFLTVQSEQKNMFIIPNKFRTIRRQGNVFRLELRFAFTSKIIKMSFLFCMFPLQLNVPIF